MTHSDLFIHDASHAESQSSQILDFALGRAGPSNAWNIDGNKSSVGAENASVGRPSNGSSGEISFAGTASSTSLSRYHFHGLAATQQTQTQSQFVNGDDSYVYGEDSQKENTPAVSPPELCLAVGAAAPSSPNKAVTATTAPFAEPPPSRHVHEAPLTPPLRSLNSPPAGQLPLSERVPPQQTKVVKFLSPLRPSTPINSAPQPSLGMKFRRKPQQASPASQDSFAGPSSFEDPDLFLATAKQFELPLHKLGLPDSQELSLSASANNNEPSVQEESLGRPAMRTISEMTPYSLSTASGGVGRVLVANSDGSSQESRMANSQLQFSDGETTDFNAVNFSQEPTQIVGNSAINLSLSSSILNQCDVSESLQVVDESSQFETTNSASVAVMVGSQEPTQEDDATSTSVIAESVISDARSILNLVPPEKRHRYMRADAILTPVVDREKAKVASAGVNAVASGSRSPAKRNVAPSSAPLRLPAAPQLHENDDIDIVPDSEVHIDVQVSPLKKTESGSSKTEEDSREEIIPPTPSEPRASVIKTPAATESPKTREAVQRHYVREEEEEEEEDAGKDNDARGEEVTEDAVEEDGGAVTEVQPAEAKPAKARKPALGMTGRNKQKGAAAKASTSAARKSGAAAKPKPVSAAKRGQTKKAALQVEAESLAEVLPELKGTRRKSARGKVAEMKGKGKARVSDPPPVATRATPVRLSERPQTPLAHDGSAGRTSESPDVPLAAAKQDEEATVVDENECMEVEEQDLAVTSSRKRKRSFPSTSATKSAARGSKSVATRADSVSIQHSIQHPSKRKKTPASFVLASAPVDNAAFNGATRVIALSKGDGHYYVGVVYQQEASPSRFVILFDDGHEQSVELAKLRRAEVRVDDVVIICSGGLNAMAKVVEVELWESSRSLRVELLDSDDGDEVDIQSKDFKLAARTVEVNWKDRMLTTGEIVSVMRRKTLKDTASPSKVSVLDGSDCRSGRALSKIGVAVTLGPEMSSERGEFMREIKELGGSLVYDWSDIFTFQGKHFNANKRWVINPDDVKYKPKEGIQNVFLISDGPCQKPKFLIALALGIPCVHVDWLNALALGRKDDWHKHLLPAGFSDTLSTLVSQCVDLNWGNSLEHVKEIMTNPVPHKVLSDKSILCLGPELMPSPSRKKPTDTMESSQTIPRIVLCMGAARVEAVAEAKYASEKDLKKFDYIVVKDAPPLPLVKGAVYVDVQWVKDCLIAGRLLKTPEWIE